TKILMATAKKKSLDLELISPQKKFRPTKLLCLGPSEANFLIQTAWVENESPEVNKAKIKIEFI
ncbi:MAG: hypothetical protein DRI99_06120, partial [Candidatus Aminicenantes bacterium]